MQIAELGQALVNFTNLMPGGMVVFVPSYSFLNLVIKHWQGNGLLEKLRAKKKVIVCVVFWTYSHFLSTITGCRCSWSHKRVPKSMQFYETMLQR
jgi:hypothetical protein